MSALVQVLCLNLTKTNPCPTSGIIGLIMVFDAILMGRQSIRNYSVCMGIQGQLSLSKIKFAKVVNRYVKILGGRFYSASLKDITWLERAQLIFLIFHTFVCKLGRVEGAVWEKNYRKMYEK